MTGGRPEVVREGAPPQESGPESLVEAPSPRRALVLALAVVACVALVTLTPLRDHVGPESVQLWRQEVEGLGAWGPLVFFGVNAVGVAIGVPRLLFTALAGALFGWVAGAGISHYAGLTGSWMTFAGGRALGREYVGGVVRRRMPRADRFLGFVGRHGLLANAVVRAAPVGHAFTTSLLMSVSPVRTRDFLLGTFLGSLPYSVVFALFGSAAKGQQTAGRVVGGAVALVLLSFGVGWWVRRVVARDRAERVTEPARRSPQASPADDGRNAGVPSATRPPDRAGSEPRA